jgi:hypothetical protein
MSNALAKLRIKERKILLTISLMALISYHDFMDYDRPIRDEMVAAMNPKLLRKTNRGFLVRFKCYSLCTSSLASTDFYISERF